MLKFMTGKIIIGFTLVGIAVFVVIGAVIPTTVGKLPSIGSNQNSSLNNNMTLNRTASRKIIFQ